MSEYWVSHKKYFCKYCNIYIADDAPSRRQHETGLRHKGNVERFVRNLYKTGEKRKQDLEEEKREMARVERAAQVAFAQDVGAGLAKPGNSSYQAPASKEAGPSKPARSTDPYADYTTAGSLGYADPDEARIQAEIERRSKEGVAGAWEVVEVAQLAPPQEEEAEEQQKPDLGTLVEASRKREAEAPPDDEDARHFRLRKKTIGVGLGEIYDPGLISIKVKKKEEPAATVLQDGAAPAGATAGSSHILQGTSAATPLPKWTAREWAKPGEVTKAESITQDVSESSNDDKGSSAASEAIPDGSATAPDMSSEVKVEPNETPVKTKAEVARKAQDSEASIPPSTGGLFKKRKVPAGNAGSRGRRM